MRVGEYDLWWPNCLLSGSLRYFRNVTSKSWRSVRRHKKKKSERVEGGVRAGEIDEGEGRRQALGKSGMKAGGDLQPSFQ